MKWKPIGRKLLTSGLSLLVVGMATIPPLLDAAEDQHGAQIESEHDPLTCAVLHDHTACSQLATSFGRKAARAGATVRPDVPDRTARRPDAVVRPLRTYSPAPSPRAPPTRIT